MTRTCLQVPCYSCLQCVCFALVWNLDDKLLLIPCTHMQADWDIVKRGWDAHVLGKAPHQFTDAVTAVKTLRVRACIISRWGCPNGL